MIDHPKAYACRKLNKAELFDNKRRSVSYDLRLTKISALLTSKSIHIFHKPSSSQVSSKQTRPPRQNMLMATIALEFDFNIVVRPGKKNIGPDHRSQLKTREDPTRIDDDLRNAHLFWVKAAPKELEERVNVLKEGKAPNNLLASKQKILALKVAPFTIMNRYLYKLGSDDILRRCALEHEREDIINEPHARPTGGHYQADMIAQKILQASLWWPTLHKDCREQVKKSDKC